MKITYIAEPAIPTCPQSKQFFPITTLWPIRTNEQIFFLLINNYEKDKC